MAFIMMRQMVSVSVIGALLLPLSTFMPVLSVTAPLTMAIAQMSDTGDRLMNEGKGGYEDRRTGAGRYYHYQVWTNSSNTRFTLKIWNNQEYPNSPPIATRVFSSGREALDYFDCRYARKCLPSCPCPPVR